MSTPDRLPVVQHLASEFPGLLETNTYESCGRFVQIVLEALGREGWGHVSKSDGEQGWTHPSGVRFSHDVIWHKPSNQQVDILGNAAARSINKPGGASPTWGLIKPHEYRAGNEWLPPVSVDVVDPPPVEPPPPPGTEPPPPPPPPPASGFDLQAAFANLWARLDQLQADVRSIDARTHNISEQQHRFTDEIKGKVATERDFLHNRVIEERETVVNAIKQIDANVKCVLRR